MAILLFILYILLSHLPVYGTLVGGRPNAISEGHNAFAGVVNPANAVWVKDRVDIGVFYLHQHSSLNNRSNNPLFPPGKTDTSYHVKNFVSGDLAINKKFTFCCCNTAIESSFSLATYTTPNTLRVRTKEPFPGAGNTPIWVYNKIQALSAILAFKLNANHSIGISTEYFYFSHKRNGFQNSDNPQRSVSPGHVTNNGIDHSAGIGLTIGWHWNITKAWTFGASLVKKSYCGQYRKYRGFEPRHAENYIPMTAGAGFSYKFSPTLAGRLEVLWTDFGNLPSANNSILPNGRLNRNKRGSNNSSGPGTQDATFINMGLGYKVSDILYVGAGYSHRLKLPSSIFISHSYKQQTIYDTLSLGANVIFQKHELFMSGTYGFKNVVSGRLPEEFGGGKMRSEREIFSFSLSWGYLL